MTDIISFRVTGSYASFRDPSVTSNQLVYYIPSKTAIVGLIGALIGIRRDNMLGDLYQTEYLDLFSKIHVGLQLNNNPKKLIYFTNYRSMKSNKTKPVKKEILENPDYRFFIQGDAEILQKISNAISKNSYSFSPYLGHAYCPAKISDLQKHDAKLTESVSNKKTDCVILDESDSNFNETFEIDIESSDDTVLVIERHLHHYFKDNDFKSRVLKHWIPVNAATLLISSLQHNTISKLYEIDDMVYCLY